MAQVSVTKTIDAPSDRVWNMVSEWGGTHKWIPGVGPVTVEGEGVGSIRSADLDPATGFTGRISERLETWDEAGRPSEQRYAGRIYAAYSEELRRRNAVDFDDLLAWPLRLLAAGNAIADPRRFRHFLVDNLLGQPLCDGCFAHASFADVERVIFPAAAENLNGSLDLILTPDQGIDFPDFCLLIEVGAIGSQCIIGVVSLLAFFLSVGAQFFVGLLVPDLRNAVRDAVDHIETCDVLLV